MFNTSYQFQKVNQIVNDPSAPHLVNKTIYRFNTKNGNRYLVEVHEHLHDVFVVKFYFNKHRKNKKKYNLLTNFNEWGGVLKTVVDICIKILKDNPKASFAFIGVPKLTEEPTLPNNQRFRVYKKITEAFLGTQTFKHVESIDANCYLLVNKLNTDYEMFSEQIIQMLSNAYQDLRELLT